VKTCVDCNLAKNNDEFYEYEFVKNRGRCKDCLKKRSKNWAKNNPDKKKESDKKFREDNIEYLKQQKKDYIENNKNVVAARKKEWYNLNKERILKDRLEYRATHKEQRNIQDCERRKNDPVYRLRTNMSKVINQRLKDIDSSKGGSIIKYLSYSFKELKIHLEQQFEPWMTWNNYGRYDVQIWNDNNTATWTWQIDHIMPQSLLPYSSMEDDNFKKCWSLENLRPLSAKQNILLGTALSKKRKK
jgi:hypothetical protein